MREVVDCNLTLDHIAALAGVCRSTVKNALREAVRLHLIRVEERRLTAWRNLPHRITIIAPEWLSWLRLARKGGAGKSVTPTNTGVEKKGFRRAETARRLAPDAGSARPPWTPTRYSGRNS